MERIDKQILEELLVHLNMNARQLSIALGMNTPQVFYDIKSGKCGISKAMANKIQEKFPSVSTDYLLTGKGSVLGNVEQKVGDNASGVVIQGQNHLNNSPIDNRHYYSDSPDVLKAQIELLDERIKEKDAQIKEKDAQIKEKDAQIKQLLDILASK